MGMDIYFIEALGQETQAPTLDKLAMYFIHNLPRWQYNKLAHPETIFLFILTMKTILMPSLILKTCWRFFLILILWICIKFFLWSQHLDKKLVDIFHLGLLLNFWILILNMLIIWNNLGKKFVSRFSKSKRPFPQALK